MAARLPEVGRYRTPAGWDFDLVDRSVLGNLPLGETSRRIIHCRSHRTVGLVFAAQPAGPFIWDYVWQVRQVLADPAGCRARYIAATASPPGHAEEATAS